MAYLRRFWGLVYYSHSTFSLINRLITAVLRRKRRVKWLYYSKNLLAVWFHVAKMLPTICGGKRQVFIRCLSYPHYIIVFGKLQVPFQILSNSPLIYSFSRLCPCRNSLVVASQIGVSLPSCRIRKQSGRIMELLSRFVLCVVRTT